MKTLSGIKISHKITSLMIGLVVGFLLMAVAYYAQIVSEKTIAEANANYKKVEQQISSVVNATSEIRAATTGYVDSGDNKLSTLYADATAKANKSLTQLAALPPRYVNAQELAKVKHSLTIAEKKYSDLSTRQARLSNNIALINEQQQLITDIKNQLKNIGPVVNAELFPRVLTTGKNLVLGEASETEYVAQIDALKAAIDSSNATDTNKQKILASLDAYNTALLGVVQDSMPKEQVNAELLATINGFTSAVQNYQQIIGASVNRRIAAAEGELNIARTMFAVVLFLTAVGTTLGLFLIYRSIVLPLWHMQAIITQQNRGNDKARVNIQANDELGNLGRAFNRLLDERIKVLSEQSQENETLNTSIIGLIRALGTIAKKDLSIKVPVSADVTGTISDAVNLLTSETARTLFQVKGFSEQINQISDQLQAQSDVVIAVAEVERAQVADTISALDQSAKAMGDIAKEARTANSIASAAIDYTQKAQLSVTQTVDGIQVIRSTISETEKRIKRLGDRSQEITSIVNLINTIAERTHILALNASMHAASAGEAGKGFAVVAEEVQRLAENARGATSEISAMVNNIRVETSDTVNIMNKLITQVADGTKLAEDSGQRMHETEAATRQLVNHVKSIAVNSMNQANAANRVRDGALLITQSTEKTHGKLEEQREQTDELKACARSLVERVSVFKLPEFRNDARQAQPTPNQMHLEKIAMSQMPPESLVDKQPAKIA